MGALARHMERRIAREMEERRVVVWWDPDRSWESWITRLTGISEPPERASAKAVELGDVPVQIIQFAGSYLEVADRSDELLEDHKGARLLVYLPGERHHEDLSPLRELECLGGDREPFSQELERAARQAFKGAGLADAQIDELVQSGSLSFDYLDDIPIDGGDEASPLAPLFGSGREEDVFPGFLTSERLRKEVAERGLLEQVRVLAERSLGVSVEPPDDADELARTLARIILVAELRDDLAGEDPLEISQVPDVSGAEARSRARGICERLRALEPDAYIDLANQVEEELGLTAAEIEPLKLGRIDTFSFEERSLLRHSAGALSEGSSSEVARLVEERASSFWTSVGHFPDRRSEWQLLGELAKLADLDAEIERELASEPTSIAGWIKAYAGSEGWHEADRIFRDIRSGLSRLDSGETIEPAARTLLGAHDEVVNTMNRGFVDHVEEQGWHVDGVLRQRDVFARRVQGTGGPVAVILADALRFEMGAELEGILKSAGATSIQVEPVLAEPPTITPVGMAALLPGAERSFEVAYNERGLHGVVEGQELSSVRERMELAKAAVPGLVELRLDPLVHDLTQEEINRHIEGAPIVVVRSIEIDRAGEDLPSGMARRIMGSVLEDIRKAALRLAEAGVERFVVVADHGHIFSFRREDDMKIDAPSGGEQVDLHRRCWVGRGGSTPSGCIRLSLRELGYTSDLDLITPRGNGVFRAGGDLAYHHGGLSLQETIVPAVSFELVVSDEKRDASSGIVLHPAADKVTNRIFSLTVQRSELPLEPLTVKILALDTEGRVVGQAMHAEAGWDPDGKVLTLDDQDPVSVAVQLNDDSIEELRVVAVEVGTDRTVKDTPPLPVSILR